MVVFGLSKYIGGQKMVSMNGNWLWGSGSSATSNYAGKMNLRQVGAKIEGEYSYPGFWGYKYPAKSREALTAT